jgi:hypothetical protein
MEVDEPLAAARQRGHDITESKVITARQVRRLRRILQLDINTASQANKRKKTAL